MKLYLQKIQKKNYKILSKTIKSIRKGSRSMAIVVEKNTFEQYHHKKNLVKPYSMNREIALKQILLILERMIL